MSVRFDTVSFQTLTVITVVSPLGLVMVTSFSYTEFKTHYTQVPVTAFEHSERKNVAGKLRMAA